MNIILISQKHGKSHNLQLSSRTMIAAVCFLLSLPLLGGSIGYYLAFDDGLGPLTQAIHADVQAQRDQLETAQQETRSLTKALTRRMAELQARIARLDALGERLVDAADLEADEFDFSQTPALGGPSGSDLGAAFEQPEFGQAIDELLADIEAREQQLIALDSLMQGHKMKNEVFVAGRPVVSGWLSSRFGRRTDPFTGRLAWHNGVDFAGKRGSDIISVASGVVTWADKRYGYGLMVEVNHGDGFATRYAHCKEVVVAVGDVVKKGQAIATMGSSGRSTGPHVHFEVWKNGKAVDPTQYVQR